MTQPEQSNTNAGREALDQAKAYDSVFAPSPLTLDDGTTIEVPPHPSLRMLDDDRLADLVKLEFKLESYDRHEIQLPERTIKDENGSEMVLPAETKQGSLREPYRKTDPETGEVELLDPPYIVQLVQVALGDDYARLRAGTIDGRRGSSADVKRIWDEQSRAIEERRAADSKSNGSTGVLEDVATPDSERPVEVPSPSDS